MKEEVGEEERELEGEEERRGEGEKQREEGEMLKFHTPPKAPFLLCRIPVGWGWLSCPPFSPVGSYRVHYLMNFPHIPWR